MNSQGCEFGVSKPLTRMVHFASHFPHCVGVPAVIQYGYAERPRESRVRLFEHPDHHSVMVGFLISGIKFMENDKQNQTPPRAPTRAELSIALRAAHETLRDLQQQLHYLIADEIQERFEKHIKKQKRLN